MVLNKETNKLINEYVDKYKPKTLEKVEFLTKQFFIKNINQLQKDKNFLMELFKIVNFKLLNKYLNYYFSK